MNGCGFSCAELNVGELIHGENFSLFEAMSALEVHICAFFLCALNIGTLAED